MLSCRHMLEWCGVPAGEVAREVEACHEQLRALALGGKEQQQQVSRQGCWRLPISDHGYTE